MFYHSDITALDPGHREKNCSNLAFKDNMVKIIATTLRKENKVTHKLGKKRKEKEAHQTVTK